MDRLHELETFVAVVDAGSLAAAARTLRLSPAAVTRALASLEARLGARLLNRTTRSMKLTEAGERFLLTCRRLLGELDEARRDLAGEASLPQGHLTITASVTLGRLGLAPILGEFLRTYPGITASLVLFDRVTHLVEEGIDVALRIGDLPDSSLITRRVGEVRRTLVASPVYLARHGTPATPQVLERHAFIAITGLLQGRDLRLQDDRGPILVPLRPRLEINDATAAIAAAEAGTGITSTYCYMVGNGLRSGRLVPVLEPWWPPPVAVQLVYPHSRLLAARVRTFVDWAAPRLADGLRRLSERPDGDGPQDTMLV